MKTSFRPAWMRWAWATVLAGIFFMYGLMFSGQTADEAWARDAACRQLALNTTEGRQALVSSVWWAPLPTLLRLPAAAALQIEGTPVASLMVSAVFGAALVLLLERLLSAWGMGLSRYAFVAAWTLNPFFFQACISGASHTILALLAVMVFAGLAGWLAFRKLRYLMILAAGSALLIGSDFILGLWALALLGVFLLDTLFSRRLAGRERESLLILGFSPPLYMVGLWLLTNWLIMGDALYFLRSLAGNELALGGMRASLVRFLARGMGPALADTRQMGIGLAHYEGVLVVLLASLAALFRRRAGGLVPGIALVLLLGTGLAFGAHDAWWDSPGLLLALSAVSVAAIGFMAAGLELVPRRLHVLAGLVSVALTAVAMLQFVAEGRGAGGPGGAGFERRRAMVQDVERYVRQRQKYAKVFVAGYEGLELLGGDPSPAFAYALDFNFNKVKNDYRGHSLFLLVRRPAGRSRTDSIHWQHRRMYAWGSRSSLFDRDWGDWRLFEIVQAPLR